MLYEGTADLIEAAASFGLPTMMTTNGTGLPAVAERLVKAPLFALQLSIDGHCAELHNALRPGLGSIDNFAQMNASLKAVHQARRSHGRGLPLLTAITAISRENSSHLVISMRPFATRWIYLSFASPGGLTRLGRSLMNGISTPVSDTRPPGNGAM